VKSKVVDLIEHNSENESLNRYHISEINYFKVLLLYKMTWHIILYECLRGMI
jgi:hypothetical protein